MSQIQSLLQQVPFFSNFPTEKLLNLIEAGTTHEIAAGTLVFNEGDVAHDLYLILEGDVEVLGQNTAGEKVLLTTLSAGQFFGELALADGGSRTATLFSTSPCRFFTLSREQFIRQMATTPELISQVISAISQKMRRSNHQYFEEQLQKQHLQLKMEQAQRQTTGRMVSGLMRELHEPLNQFRKLTEQLDMQMNQLILAGQNSPAEAIGEINTEFMMSINRMDLLLQSFKSISPTEVFARREPVQWQNFLQELQAIYRASSFRQLPINFSLEPEAAAQVWQGYPHRLMEIMMHLLLNVEAHAYPDQEGEIEIHLSLLGAGDEQLFCLRVKDQGKGIAAEHLALIYDPFYSTDEDATGLGLAIADNLATTALGGKMHVESAEGKGTEVSLTFPLVAPEMAY